MQIKQETPAFKPITIQLNTREEAEAMFDLVEAAALSATGEGQKMALKISNWFGDTAKV